MSAWLLYRAMSTSLVEAFCCQSPVLNALLRAFCLPFALELTRLGIKMEGMVARDRHLQGACRWLVEIAANDIQIDGAENIPRAGPLLLVSNHAGLGDAHAALMALPRHDTLLLARDFGILPGLAQFRQYVIVVDAARPYAAIRQSIRHLQNGGSLLLFPRGEIEADPALDLDAARASLPDWTHSIDLFARHVPDLAILPLAVAGVLSRRALNNPLVRQYREEAKRNFLAATFQMMFAWYRDAEICVRYGLPLRAPKASRRQALRQMESLLWQAHAACQSSSSAQVM
ncbi:MAG: 1-acyl-sn-glycerol-3-phosphate acyltransferase [Chloroflexi bacterium]|nr:1-acyl-sn-glycerol-3-phosphate acyltransferase [Chloroflexota bacterium]MCY4247532.1 1-acyl-sn-glycerol-3-phosphate acyltransferase [Chloroflexota bacterium]